MTRSLIEEAGFIAIYGEAAKAGNEAGGVYNPDNWYPCGASNVMVQPRNTKFAHWLVENEYGRDSEGQKAILISTTRYNQQMDAQQRWTSAFAEVLRKYNINVSTWTYID